MTARVRTSSWLTLALMLAAAASCLRARRPPAGPQRNSSSARGACRSSCPPAGKRSTRARQKRFRKGEFEIVLQNLGSRTPPPRDLDELIDWGLAEVGHDQRREVKSRRAVTLDGREAVDIETWHRLDHTNPQRIFFVNDDGELLALHTERMAFEDSLAAFDAIRDSLHFVSVRR